jgi:hypothetical protein
MKFFAALIVLSCLSTLSKAGTLVCTAGKPSSDLYFQTEYDNLDSAQATVQVFFHGTLSGQGTCDKGAGQMPVCHEGPCQDSGIGEELLVCRVDDLSLTMGDSYETVLYRKDGKLYSGITHDNNGFKALQLMTDECVSENR